MNKRNTWILCMWYSWTFIKQHCIEQTPFYSNNIKQKSDENKEKYELGDYKVIQYQILQTNITRTVWQTVRRITNVIMGVEGLTLKIDISTLSSNVRNTWEVIFLRWTVRTNIMHYVQHASHILVNLYYRSTCIKRSFHYSHRWPPNTGLTTYYM